ncbi:hypothetical protein JW813_16795 [Clostridium botulinum]|nr:hypothetical protein [Clostridium botulinum]MBY6805169.1 hypothetical protein [Clostridium botulinum]MBY6815186.1 hypothetical protein [Clostridium botulinum]MBY6821786.1 hypothetical protein [Clostridium botulinum]UZP03344.1 hypothetical protein JW813_16795 [Clostridium botulinum]UZP06702.1 hypothetical protein JYA71_17065 [Clostridium botulinum]
MVKVQIKYENEVEKNKIILLLSNTVAIKKISKPFKTGKYYRIYVDVK